MGQGGNLALLPRLSPIRTGHNAHTVVHPYVQLVMVAMSLLHG